MFFGKKRDALKRKIWIRRVSAWGMGITIFLAILFTFVCVKGAQEFRELREATDQYIVCEKAAKQLQDGSDYLTEQVRLYAMTGDTQYREAYFRRRMERRDGKPLWRNSGSILTEQIPLRRCRRRRIIPGSLWSGNITR